MLIFRGLFLPLIKLSVVTAIYYPVAGQSCGTGRTFMPMDPILAEERTLKQKKGRLQPEPPFTVFYVLLLEENVTQPSLRSQQTPLQRQLRLQLYQWRLG